MLVAGVLVAQLAALRIQRTIHSFIITPESCLAIPLQECFFKKILTEVVTISLLTGLQTQSLTTLLCPESRKASSPASISYTEHLWREEEDSPTQSPLAHPV